MYLGTIVAILNIPGVLVGYCTSYSNQVEFVLDEKFGFDTDDKQLQAASWIGASITLGMTLGAVSGGRIIKIGRRKTLFLSICLGILGLSITMVENFNVILVGRLIFGYSGGVMSVTAPRFVEETVPNHLFSTLGPLFTFTQTVGTLIAYLLGEVLPDPDGPKDMIKNSNSWRIVYGYFPIGCFLVLIGGLLFILDHDALKFLINQKKDKEAERVVGKIYKGATTPELRQKYVAMIRANSGKDTSW